MILIKYKKITNNIQTKIQEGISRAVAVSHIVWASRLNISPILSELFMTHLRQDISTICLQYFSNFERFFYHPPEARYSSKKYSNIQSNNIQTKIHVNIPGAPEAKLQFTGTDIWYFDQIVDENIKSWYNCQ